MKLATLLVMSTSLAIAAAPPQQQFRSSTTVVRLEVSISKDGQGVRDLRHGHEPDVRAPEPRIGDAGPGQIQRTETGVAISRTTG